MPSNLIKKVKRLFSHRHRWSIKEYFVYSTLFLLLPGFLISLYLLNHTLNTHYVSTDITENFSAINKLINKTLNEKLNLLAVQAAGISSLEEIGKCLTSNDRERLVNIILPYIDEIKLKTGYYQLGFHFYDTKGVSFLRTWDIGEFGDDLTSIRKIPLIVNQEHRVVKGIEIGKSAGFALRAAAPIRYKNVWVGAVEAILPFEDVCSSFLTSKEWSYFLFLEKKHYTSKNLLSPLTREVKLNIQKKHETPPNSLTNALSNTNSGNYILVFKKGEFSFSPFMLSTPFKITQAGNFFFQNIPIKDFQEREIGRYLLIFDATEFYTTKNKQLLFFSSALLVGLCLIISSVYFFSYRVGKFFEGLRETITYIVQGDFSKRIPAKRANCWEILNCNNSNCVVYQNPNFICYLEVGSCALLPEQRRTCIWLKNNKNRDCDDCPVRWLKGGNEISELTNWFNSLTNIFDRFFSSVVKQLTEIFGMLPYRRAPSLKLIQTAIDQLLNASRFRRHIQGTSSQEEIYNHISYILKNHFNLHNFIIYEVNNSENRIEIKVLEDKYGIKPSMQEILLNPQLCRAKRNAEEVDSFANPLLCPFASLDTDKYFHYCLPVVMGGRIGMVVKIFEVKEKYENLKSILSFIKKYLEEAAPILESQRLFQITRMQSLKDPLTGCYNRRFLEEYLTKYELLAKRQGSNVGMLMIDIDHFKLINDTYGHNVGDMVLKAFAQIVRKTIRASDFVFRYGGEEFLVVLPDIKKNTAFMVAEKIRTAVESTNIKIEDGRFIKITVSIGVAEFPQDGPTIRDCIKFADVAVYVAKNQGRNQTVRFKPEMWKEEESQEESKEGEKND